MCYCCGVFVKTTRRRRGDKTYEYLSLVESVLTYPNTKQVTNSGQTASAVLVEHTSGDASG